MTNSVWDNNPLWHSFLEKVNEDFGLFKWVSSDLTRTVWKRADSRRKSSVRRHVRGQQEHLRIATSSRWSSGIRDSRDWRRYNSIKGTKLYKFFQSKDSIPLRRFSPCLQVFCSSFCSGYRSRWQTTLVLYGYYTGTSISSFHWSSKLFSATKSVIRRSSSSLFWISIKTFYD